MLQVSSSILASKGRATHLTLLAAPLTPAAAAAVALLWVVTVPRVALFVLELARLVERLGGLRLS
jgi:hypothetical protein